MLGIETRAMPFSGIRPNSPPHRHTHSNTEVMSTVSGLPAHVLLVHFMVVLTPVTAILVAVCGVWPAARRQLIWLTVALATVVLALTPVTTDAGEWLEDHVERSAAVHTHTELGDTMVYFAAVLFLAALILAALHLRERTTRPSTLLRAVAAALALVTATAMIVQIYRVGESGSRAVWGDIAASSDAAAQTRQSPADSNHAHPARRYDLGIRWTRP